MEVFGKNKNSSVYSNRFTIKNNLTEKKTTKLQLANLGFTL
jgi:hypothetical protein